MKKFQIGIFIAAFLVSFFISNNFMELKMNNPKFEIEENTSGALKALNFWTRSRAYPNEDIPTNAYYKAYKYSKSNLAKRNNLNSYSFEQLGPHNIGGRTLDVQLNPQNTNTIFAGSASGGLWRSYTGGVGVSAWEKIPMGYPVLGVSSIAIVPNDSNTIYI